VTIPEINRMVDIHELVEIGGTDLKSYVAAIGRAVISGNRFVRECGTNNVVSKNYFTATCELRPVALLKFQRLF